MARLVEVLVYTLAPSERALAGLLRLAHGIAAVARITLTRDPVVELRGPEVRAVDCPPPDPGCMLAGILYEGELCWCWYRCLNGGVYLVPCP